jgi:hypothetical protein
LGTLFLMISRAFMMSPLAPGTGLISITDISSSFGASAPCCPYRPSIPRSRDYEPPMP